MRLALHNRAIIGVLFRYWRYSWVRPLNRIWDQELDAIYELKRQMLFLERAHASARMGHFVLDPKRRTIEFSSWVRENIGLNDMPIPLDRLAEIVPKDAREQFAERVDAIISAEQDFAFETDVITATGKVRTQRVTGIPAFEDQSKRQGLIGFYGILHEITSEKEAQRDLVEARDKAQAELDARTNILAAVSHEIRTPLGGVLGIIDQLRRERSATERERALSLMEDSCQALLHTLDAILQQARLAQSIIEIERKPFRPLAVAQRVAELFRPLARRKGLKIEVKAGDHGEVLGDVTRIQQVLANFVSNAVKFTQSGAVEIIVEAPSDVEERWVFIVRDSGSGLDENRLESIFDPFGESSEDTLGRAFGAGIGLSISRDLVEAMGGSIEVQSEVGKGSSFRALLPLEALDSEQESSSNNSVLGRAVIMIDRATDAVQAEAIFSQFGYQVTSIEDLRQAHPMNRAPTAVIADASKIETFSKELLRECEHVIALACETELQARSAALNSEVSLIAGNNLARSLRDLLDSDS